MLRDAICIIAGLFILGIAGGLERNLISIPGALVAWAAAIIVIAVMVIIGRRKNESRRRQN